MRALTCASMRTTRAMSSTNSYFDLVLTSSQRHSHTTFDGTQGSRPYFFELYTGHSLLETARNWGDWQHSCLFWFVLFSFVYLKFKRNVNFICFPFGMEFEGKFKSKFQPSEIAPPWLVSFGAARGSDHC